MAAAKKNTKINLKEKIDEDSLDLSVCDLNTIDLVPIKQIADMTKIRKLNLSYNSLEYLHDDFIKLQNIRVLDLSKNHLKFLPYNFGQLVNLKNLDLLGNDLVTLPSSFADMKALTWLDLKDNPLKADLKKVAGDCLDEGQCKKCAVNVIKFMKQIAADDERNLQLELKKKKEKDLKKEKEQLEKANQMRLQKKQEREERYQNIQRKKRDQRESTETLGQGNTGNGVSSTNVNSNKKQRANAKSGSWLGSLIRSIFYVSIILFTLYFLFTCYCSSKKIQDIQLFKHPALSTVVEGVEKNVCLHLNQNKIPIFQDFLKWLKLTD